jgi:thiol-disulfide isomerase/thioredoxin
MDLLMKRAFLPLALFVLLSGTAAVAAETDQKGTVHAWTGPSSGYTVVDFAASWCRPCWAVLPRLQTFASEHPDIRVLVVDVDDTVKGRDALVEKMKLTLPVLWDEKHRIAEHYRPEGMPATFVLDPEGHVVYKHVGSSKKEWDAMVAFLETATRH